MHRKVIFLFFLTLLLAGAELAICESSWKLIGDSTEINLGSFEKTGPTSLRFVVRMEADPTVRQSSRQSLGQTADYIVAIREFDCIDTTQRMTHIGCLSKDDRVLGARATNETFSPVPTGTQLESLFTMTCRNELLVNKLQVRTANTSY